MMANNQHLFCTENHLMILSEFFEEIIDDMDWLAKMVTFIWIFTMLLV